MVDPAVITGVCAGVLALIAFLYGIFRKFTRVSWLSWQVLIVFAATLLVGVIPVPDAAWGAFAVAAGILVVPSAVLLIIGGAVRHAMLKRVRPAPLFFRVCSRLLGGLTAVLNVAVFLLVFALPVLTALPLFGVQPEALSFLYESAVWDWAAAHALDLFTAAGCVVFMRAGYRIGLARSLWTVIAVLLSVVALALSVVLALRVPFLTQFAGTISAALPASLGVFAGVIGTAVVALLCFLVLFAVVLLLNLLVNQLMKKIVVNPVLGAIDGVLMSVVFTALFFALSCGIGLGIAYLSANAAALPVGEQLVPVLSAIEGLLTSSPLSAVLYLGNPALLLL